MSKSNQTLGQNANQTLTPDAIQNVIRRAVRKNARLTPRVGGGVARIEAVEGRRMLTAIVADVDVTVVHNVGVGSGVTQSDATTLRTHDNTRPDVRPTIVVNLTGAVSPVTFGTILVD